MESGDGDKLPKVPMPLEASSLGNWGKLADIAKVPFNNGTEDAIGESQVPYA